MSACWLVRDLVAHNVDVLGKGLGEGALRVADQLLLALCARDQVHNIARAAVHVTVDAHGLA